MINNKTTFSLLQKSFLQFSGLSVKKRLLSNQVQSKEIKIPTQWGHVAGKLWGNEHQRPILALHGWQDNAGTWDRIAPILAKYHPILAIDFPGHGFSSWYPSGMQYHFWDWPILIQNIKQYFEWSEITILAHSISSCVALRYVSLFPDEVKAFVAIDALIYNNQTSFRNCISNLLELHKSKLREPPAATYELIRKKWHEASSRSVEQENVVHLAKRGVQPSTIHPDKFYVSRDPRLKHMLFPAEDMDHLQKMLSRMTVPTLYIRATGTIYSHLPLSLKLEEYLVRNNDRFVTVTVEGTHHVHLNNPEIVAPLILNFFSKYGVIEFEASESLNVKDNLSN